MLEKTRTVLQQQDLTVGDPYIGPVFAGEETSRNTKLQMDHDVWVEMGQPQTITITIRPGDQLNK